MFVIDLSRARLLTAGILLLFVGLGAGCGPKVAAPVDAQKARATLDAVLADWKAGGTPEAWQQKSPKVVVQDFDWTGGAKLISYEIQGNGDTRDANLYCKVQIVTATGAQTNPPRVVSYVVGTDPVLTVFRDMFN